MKLWMIREILADEMDVYIKYFDLFQDPQRNIPIGMAMKIFSKSNKIFLITDTGYLRMTLPGKLAKPIEAIPIVEVFRRYGEDAIYDTLVEGEYKIDTTRPVPPKKEKAKKRRPRNPRKGKKP